MKAAPFLIILLPAVALATGTATDQITMKPQASPSCTSGRACIYGKSGTNRVYIVDSAGLELQSNAARSFRTSADCSALSSPANGDVCYDTTLTAFRLYSAGWTSAPANDSLLVHKAGSETITGAKTFSAAPVFAAGLTASGASANDFSGGSGTFKTSTGAVTIGPGAVTISGTLAAALAFGGNKGTGLGTPTTSTDAATKGYVDAAAPEIWFTRTCTLTSAAAATPVVCLADASVTGSKSAYLMGWHIKVHGATAWATTANCWIADTSGAGGTGLIFVTAAVAALTGNAFVADHSANVTQGDAYALNSGSTATKGLQVACDANGTGSDLVVTVFGTIK